MFVWAFLSLLYEILQKYSAKQKSRLHGVDGNRIFLCGNRLSSGTTYDQRQSSFDFKFKRSFSFFLIAIRANIEMNLTRALFHPSAYDKSIRPAQDHRETTNVSFDLSLAQLIDVDEKNQIITTNQWLAMVKNEFVCLFRSILSIFFFVFRVGSTTT